MAFTFGRRFDTSLPFEERFPLLARLGSGEGETFRDRFPKVAQGLRENQNTLGDLGAALMFSRTRNDLSSNLMNAYETGQAKDRERLAAAEEEARRQGFVGAVQGLPDLTPGMASLAEYSPEAVASAWMQNWGASETWTEITDPDTGWRGRQNAAGDIQWYPEGMQPATAEAADVPAEVDEYNFYVQQETAAGRTPKSYNEWDLERRGRLGGIDPTVSEQRYGLLYQNAVAELPTVEQTFYALSELGNQVGDMVPVINNFLTSPDYQVALDAVTQIVQMQTYALTGAAATESEAARIAATLLPEIGDSPERLAEKLERIRRSVANIRGPAGPAVGDAAATPPPAGAGDNPAPDGTVIMTEDGQTYIKLGGQWQLVP